MGFGGFGGGGMVGGGFGGGPRAAANPGGGLPFAGIPSELQDGVDKLLAGEPEHPDPDIKFTFRASDSENTKLSLMGLIFKYWQLGVLALVLITILSVVNQAGPKLIDIGITDGMEPGHKNFG